MTVPPATTPAHDAAVHAADAGADLPVLVAVIVLGAVYAVGATRLRARGVQPWSRTLLFAAGLATVAATASGPVHGSAHASLTGHMSQHILLMVVAAPLLALSRPGSALLAGAGRRLSARVVRAARPLRRRSMAPAAMAAICAGHIAVLILWHVPGPYDAAVASPMLHRAEHATILGSAVLLWWALGSAARARGTGPRVAGVGCAAAAMTACGVLGLALMLSPGLWYVSHAGLADPVADQQAGGALMWGPGGVAWAAAATALALRIVAQTGRADRAAGRA